MKKRTTVQHSTVQYLVVRRHSVERRSHSLMVPSEEPVRIVLLLSFVYTPQFTYEV